MPFTAIFTICAALAQTPTEAMEQDASRRLSAAWSRAAVAMLAEPGSPGAESFIGALEVALAAAELAPNEAQGWRTVVDLAELGDTTQPAVAAANNRALKELGRLDPTDDSVRLARITEAIERAPTADERLKAYEKALSPESRKSLGAAVSARLALDLALLEKRRGVPEAWVRRLREAVAIDPSFPMAAETLAGVEAGTGAPLQDVAAALARSVAADPGSVVSTSALARICLHEGLYEEAERLLALAARAANLNLDLLMVDELIADRLLALWGLGRHDEAIKAYGTRRREVNAALRQRLGDTTATTSEADQSSGPQVHLPDAENSVWVAVMASRLLSPAGEFDASKEAERKQLADALAYTLEGLTQQGVEAKSDAEKAVIDLRKAWLEATIGDPASVDGLLESAQRMSPLSDEAVARFQGWVRLRRGDFARALELLQPIAAKDSGARVGAAMALAGLGRQRDAAKELLAVARENRDNVVGVFAADRLEGLVKKRPGPSAEAEAVRTAVARIPESVYGLVNTQAQALSSTIAFGATSTAFDPIPLRVTVQNRTALPLEITPDGPIESKAALLLEATIIGKGKSESLPPCIISIDRRMLLKPRESVVLELDMGRTKLGAALLSHPLVGIFVNARLVTNFRLSSDRVQAGFLGNLSEEAALRIPATQIDAGWRESTLGEIRNPDTPGDLVKLVQYAHDLARTSDDDKQVEAGWAAVNESWARLPPVGQAWALMVLPNAEGQLKWLAPTLDAAKVSKDDRVRTSYLLRWVLSRDDASLEAAERVGGRMSSVARGVRAMREAMARDSADPTHGTDLGVFGGSGGSTQGP